MVPKRKDQYRPARPNRRDACNSSKEFQLETDVYYNAFQNKKNALISSTLLRVGLVKKAEFRLVVEEGRQRDAFIETTQGVYPLCAGTKVSLVKEHDWIPNLSLISYLQLPFTSRTSENQMQWSPAFILATEYEIGKLSADINTGYKWNAFDVNSGAVGSVAFRYEWSVKVQSFIEYFGQYSATSHPLHNADAGLMYLCDDNILLNLSFGHTLFAEEYNSFGMLGAAIRLPR